MMYEVVEISSTCSLCDLRLPPLCTLHLCISEMVGTGSSVGIATDYGLDGPGSNTGGGQEFAPVHTGPWGPHSLL